MKGVGASQSPVSLRRVNLPPGTTLTGRHSSPHPTPRKDFLPSLFLWHNFPPEKVSLRMRGPRGGGAVGGVTLSHGSQAAPGTSGALLGASIPLRRKKKITGPCSCYLGH